MVEFEYFEPQSIDEAVSLLAEYRGQAQILAGGSDLLPRIHQDAVRPKYIINIATIAPGLDYLKFDDQGGLKIGALTTIRTFEKSAQLGRRYPLLVQAANQFGNISIRNVATVGGNICRGNPSADTPPGLIALSARLELVGPGGRRVVPLEEFFVSPGVTALQSGEMVTQIEIPAPPAETRSAYLKYTLRGADLAVVGAAAVVTLDPETNVCTAAKIALAGAGPRPMRSLEAEKILTDQLIDEALISQAAQAAADESRPRERSYRASPQYRRKIIKVVTRRALAEALA
ncbi:MAG: xanthine dehydrogenase family protein subunit M [Deltaproteobacteria bacterium]|nr:xanthine dehydrogenase family protein subunit M [Deltaproteobacteria bacterium]